MPTLSYIKRVCPSIVVVVFKWPQGRHFCFLPMTCSSKFCRIVSPEQLTYSRVPPNGSITRVDQLGPTFSVSFVVRNSGPSTVTNIKLVIYWPLNSTNSDGFYYLYPAEFSVSFIEALPCISLLPALNQVK